MFRNYSKLFEIIRIEKFFSLNFSTVMVLALLLFTSCNKESEIQAVQKTDHSKIETKSLIMFYNTMQNLDKRPIESRNDTSYSYNDLVYMTLESIGYEHSDVDGINETKIRFSDTLSMPYTESGQYNSTLSATFFNTVLDQLKANAATCTTQPYYLGAFLRSLNHSGDNQSVEMISVFSSDQDNANSGELTIRGPIPNPISMPENRYFGVYGDCTGYLSDEILGAATYLRDWILANNDLKPQVPIGYYIGDQNWIVSADPDATSDYIYQTGAIESYYMTSQMLADNPNDVIQDGHLDRVTYYYYHDTQEPIADFYAATCVSPTELQYYAPTARTVLLNTIDHYNYDFLLALGVEDAYDFVDGTNSRYQHNYWKFTAQVGRLKYAGGPTPQTPL